MLNDLRKETDKLLKHEIFSFNKFRSEYTYFPGYVRNLHLEYLSLIDNKVFWGAFCSVHYPNNPETINRLFYLDMIKEFSDKILECIDSYYLGKVNLSYNHLRDGLNDSIFFDKSDLFKGGVMTIPENELVAYRLRNKELSNNSEIARGDMFHIPFQLREHVKTQRFSIPGHPSLYLGDSIYVCWSELGEPKINNVFASKFSNSKPLNIIEILSCQELISRLNKDIEPTVYSSELFRYLLFYPLNIACSIKTKNKEDTFKSEYIVPQLFLQYVMEHSQSIDGIKYYSTRVDSDRLENVSFNNYVFPSQTNRENGYCEKLNEQFALTNPLIWEYEEINHGNVTFYGATPRKNISLELIKGRKVPYDWTTFRAIEKTLDYPSMTLERVF